jgi:serine/threonine protein kinase/predicted Zn-dependent protease
MNLSVGRRTWDEASSPTAVRAAQRYEQAWRDSGDSGVRPALADFLPDSAGGPDGPGTRLALLRADMSLRWEAGEKVDAQMYIDNYPQLGEDTVVALIYEEFCLREDDDQHPDASQFLARFPQFAGPLSRVLQIHELVGSGSNLSLSLSPGQDNARSPQLTFPETGQVIAGFYLVEELGRGAFGRVFLARERQLADRPVALKVTRRGSREPQTLARLQHTHIVPVHSHRIDAATGLHLLCMPYFGRITLASILADPEVQIADSGAALVDALDRLDRSEAIPDGLSAGRASLLARTYPEAIAWWGARLAEALEHAHDRGVLHRDIKPSNVLVTCDGMPMLLDFNLAREPVLEDGSTAAAKTLGGTIDYMAPEHLQALAEGCSDRVDRRTDIYGLGMVLYEALIGNRPFQSPRRGASVVETLLRAADERRRLVPLVREIRPDIPPALEAVIRRCLQPAPEDRYQRAADLAVDLHGVANDRPLVYAREPLTSRVAGWFRRKRFRLATASAIVLAVASVLGAGLLVFAEKREAEESIRNEYGKGVELLENDEFEKALMHFNNVEQFAGRFDLNLWERLVHGGSIPGFVSKVRGWLSQSSVDVEEVKAQARFKSHLAAETIKARRDALALFQAADGLRFRLLLSRDEDLTEAMRSLHAVLEPLYVFKSQDWADVDTPMLKPLTRLVPAQRERVKQEVNELLFLWTAAIFESLERAPADGHVLSPIQRQAAFATAVGFCDRALAFARPREPWLALKARLQLRQQSETDQTARTRGDSDGDGFDEPQSAAGADSAVACFQWALLCFLHNRLDRAADYLDGAVRLKPENYWYHCFLAIVRDNQGRLDDALLHYGQAVAIKPDSPWIMFNRARVYRATGRWRWAIEDLKDALLRFRSLLDSGQSLAPGSEIARVHLELGYLYGELGDFPRASHEYQQILASDPPDSDFARAARLNQANLDAESGAVDKAMHGYEVVLSLKQNDETVLRSRALLELKLGHAAQALGDLNTVLKLYPHHEDRDDVLAMRALAHLVLNQPTDAVEDAKEAMRIRRSPPHDRLVQRSLLAARRLDELKLDRPEEVANLPLGGARLFADLRAVARALGQRALSQKGDAFRSLLTQAVILAVLGEPAAADSAASEALALSPYSSHAYLIRARVRYFGGRRQEAWNDVERGLGNQTRHAGLLELRGAMRTVRGDADGALEDLSEAMAEGASYQVHLHKAAAFAATAHEGDLERAVQEWSLVLRADPELPEAFLGRARAQIRLRRWNQALADLRQAVTWAHSDPWIELKILGAFARCLPENPDRFPRWLALARRTARDFYGTLAPRVPGTLTKAD